jgi:hypothetical protein
MVTTPFPGPDRNRTGSFAGTAQVPCPESCSNTDTDPTESLYYKTPEKAEIEAPRAVPLRGINQQFFIFEDKTGSSCYILT